MAKSRESGITGNGSNDSREQRTLEIRNASIRKSSRTIKDEYNEYMVVFNRRGREIYRHTDGQHGEVGFGDRWREAVGSITVHNHPEGNCFSGADCKVAQAMGLEEMWAVTSDRIQTFKWNYTIYSNGNGATGAQLHAERFAKVVDEMHNRVWSKASEKWDKAHPRDKLFALSAREFDRVLRDRRREITETAQKMQRDWFRKNQEKYDYQYSDRRWK